MTLISLYSITNNDETKYSTLLNVYTRASIEI